MTKDKEIVGVNRISTKRLFAAVFIFVATLIPSFAQAQQVNLYCDTGILGTGLWQPCQSSNPLAVTGSFTPSGTQTVAGADPCFASVKTNLPINGNGTSSTQLIALSGSTTIYVCSLSLIAAGATTVAFTTGTGTACVTNNAAVIGSTTANIANSVSLAANGGLTLGSGVGTIASGAAAGEFCMILGSSVYVAGNLTYVQK